MRARALPLPYGCGKCPGAREAGHPGGRLGSGAVSGGQRSSAVREPEDLRAGQQAGHEPYVVDVTGEGVGPVGAVLGAADVEPLAGVPDVGDGGAALLLAVDEEREPPGPRVVRTGQDRK